MKWAITRGKLSRGSWRTGSALVIFLLACNVLLRSSTVAAPLGTRSVLIGTSQPNAITSHTFTFNTVSTGTLGSIEFQYCTNSPLVGTPCTAPAGLNVAAAVLSSQTGQSGFSIDGSTTANDLIISRTPSLASPGTLAYQFDNITNPSAINQSVYVRIQTYAAVAASPPATDGGSVVFVITNGIGTTAFVPPHLILCVGAVVALNCSSQLNNIQDMGILTTKTTGSTTTQFSIGTNDPGGYSVYVFGPTMTSGNNVIQPAPFQQLSQRGVSQFGLNLVANGSPPVGANPAGVGTGVVQNGYNLANFFKFQSGDLIARSIFSTDYTLFTVSYIANIDKTQSPGLYTTTMTYVGTAAF